jgi:cyclopropane fatty-acyl-phospholipid synthase-like methyltransferase
MGRRPKLPLAVVGILLVGILINLATNAASAQAHWPGWLDLVRVYAWIALAILAAALVYLTWRTQPRKSKKRDPSKVADLLAGAVKAQWQTETKRRRVFNPYALPVRWVAADSALFTPWPVIVKQAAGSPGISPEFAGIWAADPAELAGGDKELADVFGQVPTRMLVVLGDPGAGKTILLVRFVLELLSTSRRKVGGPVPIVLPVASWNPEAEDLHSWIERWIATDPAGLARLTPDAPGMARALLQGGLILPILDGFDEIPDQMRVSAIEKINEAVKPEPGLILTSRTTEYRDAVNGKSGIRMVLDGAAGIKLCPLDARIVTDYLKESSDSPEIAERWDVVTSTLTADKPAPAAQALTTPLMVTLARAIYNPHDNENVAAIQQRPAELLNSRLFKNKEDVETYLLDKFIWAAYRSPSQQSHASGGYTWNYLQAKRWLVFLARNGGPEIAWWRLYNATPKYLVGTVLAVILAVAAAIGYPFVGYGLGVTAGLLFGYGVRTLMPSFENKLFPSLEKGIIRGLFGGVIGGALAGLIAITTLPDGPKNYGVGAYLAGGLGVGIASAVLGDLIAGLAAGLTGGIVVTFYENAAAFSSLRTWVGGGSHILNGVGIALAAILTVELSNRRPIPSQGLRWSLVWTACGLVCGLTIGFIALIQIGGPSGLLMAIAAPIAGCLTGGTAGAVRSKPESAVPPSVVLRNDRGAFFRSWLVFGVALGLITGIAGGLSPGPAGHPNGIRFGILEGLSNAIIPGLGLAFIQARWGTFAIARCWLALKGQLPWRLMTFLDDAYINRGVFRQTGAVYEFRHINLQRRLAGSEAESGSVGFAGRANDRSPVSAITGSNNGDDIKKGWSMVAASYDRTSGTKRHPAPTGNGGERESGSPEESDGHAASAPYPRSDRGRQITVPNPPRVQVRAMFAKAVIRRAARLLPFNISLSNEIGTEYREPVMHLRRPNLFYRRLGASGMIGFGESYQAGDWDSDDLAALLTVFTAGIDAFVPPTLQRIRGHSAAARRPRVEDQTIGGSRSNSNYHYSLPEELFCAFLDETMCYSSAIFPVNGNGTVIADEDALPRAQRGKIDRLLDLVGVGSGTRVLEIGTGWGELAVRAAQRGALVHTVTNMPEHASYARSRASQGDVADRVKVDLRDYRELSVDDGSFDAIVSVEMIEAVGRNYWPTFFQTLERLLAPQGSIGLQAMTMQHDRMLRTSTTYTWIDKYIFPGGVIPSIDAIEQTLAGHTRLRVLNRLSYGDHYRATLSLWRTRFNRNWPDVAALGFDDVFRRTWNFYLAYCEAGFAAQYLDVHQFLIGR